MSAVDRVGDRRAQSRSALLRSVLFSLVVPPGIAVGIPALFFVDDYHRNLLLPHAVPGLALIAGGAAVYIWCALQFSLRGLGSPSPLDPPLRLVVSGPYRYVRNPMYSGVLASIVGQGLTFLSEMFLLHAGITFVMCTLYSRYVEEPSLRRRFGKRYERYCRLVGQWIPRRRSRRPVT